MVGDGKSEGAPRRAQRRSLKAKPRGDVDIAQVIDEVFERFPKTMADLVEREGKDREGA